MLFLFDRLEGELVVQPGYMWKMILIFDNASSKKQETDYSARYSG